MITEQTQKDGTKISFKRVPLYEGIKCLMEQHREVKIWGKYTAKVYKYTQTTEGISLLLAKADFDSSEWEMASLFIGEESLIGNSAEIILTKEELNK